MAVDIYPFGEAEITFEILQAISLMFDGIQGDRASVMGMARLAMIMGLLMVLVRSVVSQKIDFANLLMSVVLWLGLIVPSITVNVYNRHTAQMAGTTTVPLAIGGSAYILGTVSNGITNLFNNNFANVHPWPNNSAVASLKAIVELREKLKPGGLGEIETGEFGGGAYLNDNMSQYVTQCVLYKYMTQANPAAFLDQILSSADVLAAIAPTGNEWMITQVTNADGSKNDSTCSDQHSRLVAITSDPNYKQLVYEKMARDIFGSGSIDEKSSFLAASIDRVVYLAAPAAEANVAFMNTLYVNQHLQYGLVNASATAEAGSNFFLAKMIADARETRTIKTLADATLWSEVVWKYATIVECLTYALLPLIIFFMFMGDFGVKIFWKHLAIMAWVALWPPIAAVVESFISYSYDNSVFELTTNAGSMFHAFEVYKSVGEWLSVGYNMYMMVPAIAFMIVGGGAYTANSIISNMDFGDTVKPDNLAPTTASQPFGSAAAVSTQTGVAMSYATPQNGYVPNIELGTGMTETLGKQLTASKALQEQAQAQVGVSSGKLTSSLESLAKSGAEVFGSGWSHSINAGSNGGRSLTASEQGTVVYGAAAAVDGIAPLTMMASMGGDAQQAFEKTVMPSGKFSGKTVAENFDNNPATFAAALAAEEPAWKQIAAEAKANPGSMTPARASQILSTVPHIREGKGSVKYAGFNGTFFEGNKWKNNKALAEAGLLGLKGISGVAAVGAYIAGAVASGVDDMFSLDANAKLSGSQTTTSVMSLANTAGKLAEEHRGTEVNSSVTASVSETRNAFEQHSRALTVSAGATDAYQQALTMAREHATRQGVNYSIPGQGFLQAAENFYQRNPEAAVEAGKRAFQDRAPGYGTKEEWARRIFDLSMQDVKNGAVGSGVLSLAQQVLGDQKFDPTRFGLDDSADTRQTLGQYYKNDPEKAAKSASLIGEKIQVDPREDEKQRAQSAGDYSDRVTKRLQGLLASNNPQDRMNAAAFIGTLKEQGIQLPIPDLIGQPTDIKRGMGDAVAESLTAGQSAYKAKGLNNQELNDAITNWTPKAFAKLGEDTTVSAIFGGPIGQIFQDRLRHKIQTGPYSDQELEQFRGKNGEWDLEGMLRKVDPDAASVLELARGAPKDVMMRTVNLLNSAKGLSPEGQQLMAQDVTNATRLMAVGQYLNSPQAQKDYAQKPEELNQLRAQYNGVIGKLRGGAEETSMEQLVNGAVKGSSRFYGHEEQLAQFTSIAEMRDVTKMTTNGEISQPLKDLMSRLNQSDAGSFNAIHDKLTGATDAIQKDFIETTQSAAIQAIANTSPNGSAYYATKLAEERPVSEAVKIASGKDTFTIDNENLKPYKFNLFDGWDPSGGTDVFGIPLVGPKPAKGDKPENLPVPMESNGIINVTTINPEQDGKGVSFGTSQFLEHTAEFESGTRVYENFIAYSNNPFFGDVRLVEAKSSNDLGHLGPDMRKGGYILDQTEEPNANGKRYFLVGQLRQPTEQEVQQYQSTATLEQREATIDALAKTGRREDGVTLPPFMTSFPR